MKPRALVLSGEGLNCEEETLWALTQAGATGEVIHVNELYRRPAALQEVSLFVIPGGFSFADELGSGRVLAIQLGQGLKDAYPLFRQRGGLVLGICNGLQVLSELNWPFPQCPQQRAVALRPNHPAGFLNRWVPLEVNPSLRSPWLSQLQRWQKRQQGQQGQQAGRSLRWPIRHAEGRLLAAPGCEEQLAQHWAFRYLENVNGSYAQVAGVVDPSGEVLGLMPHPEADRPATNFYHAGPGATPGEMLFQSAIEHLSGQSARSAHER